MPAISGVARDASNNPVQKLVRVYRRDTGELAGQAVSDSVTGAYSITTRDTSEHTAVLLSGSLSTAHVADIVLSCPLTGNTSDNTAFVDAAGHVIQNPALNKVRRVHWETVSGGDYGYVASFAEGSYLSTVADADFTIGTGDFTVSIDLYLRADLMNGSDSKYPVGVIGTHAPGVAYQSQSSGFDIWLLRTGEAVLRWNGVNYSALIFPDLFDRWTRLTLSRESGTIHWFINGAWAGSFSESSAMPADRLFIGNGPNGNTNLSNANEFFARNLLVVNGTALFNATTLPSATNILDVISGGTENAVILDRLVPV